MNDRDSRERHGSAILSHANVREIRELSFSGVLTQRRLAELYGVHVNTINSLVNFKHWKHVGA